MNDPISEIERIGPTGRRTAWGPVGAIVAVILLMAFGFALTLALTGAFLVLLEGDMSALSPGDSRGVDDPDLMLATVLALFVSQLATAFLVWMMSRRGGTDRRRALYLDREPHALGVAATAIGFTLAAAALIFAVYMISPFDPTESLRAFIKLAQSPYWWLVFLVLTVGAALSEELAFRGLLMAALMETRLGAPGAAIVTSGIWTVVHFGYAPQALACVFVMGLALAAIVQRTGSLWHTLAAHATYNASAFAYYRWFVTLPPA